ncbi:negative regulator of hrp expression HrpV [Pseudomonas orientalis]|nr:negative regulator of hrp expression HrpV [Pseudomonas orientalis]
MRVLHTVDGSRHRAFLNSLLGGSDAAHLQIAYGISAYAMRAGARRGLTVKLAREVLHPRQLQQALQRRFEQPIAFDGCFIYLDSPGNLLIWHVLPASQDALDRTLARLLSLVNLEVRTSCAVT